MERSEVWGELVYRPLTAPWSAGLELFRFAGAWAPSPEQIVSGWGAWHGERVCGALLAERSGSCAMLHGPVVVAPAGETLVGGHRGSSAGFAGASFWLLPSDAVPSEFPERQPAVVP